MGPGRQLAAGAMIALAACRGSCASPEPMSIAHATPLPGADPFAPELAARLAAALAAQGSSYVPRTHHLEPSGAPTYVNRLILETSPYLLQHAHNPVSWFPWGDEAFAAAAALGRPVLLSVGYSTCHWCHVMERESFEDEEIAAFINQHFVAIKVDREERPDVDAVYMTAVQLTTGGGGWPMTIVMLPDRTPFFGGTYFPARDGDRGGSLGFLTVLRRLSDAYTNDRAHVTEAASRLATAIRETSAHVASDGVPGPEALVRAAAELARRFDTTHGGFGRAPKFPRPSTYELLLRYARRSGDRAALAMVTQSLQKMKDGGIYDHLAGGFARYSTDARWLVPHFEKMLYDNAQLAVLYTEAYQATGDAELARVVRDVLDYVLREMTSADGAFYSATDADSEGEEGKFFVWTPAEITAVVGEARARMVGAYYGVTDAGNFEGSNIFSVTRSHEEVAQALGMSADVLRSELALARLELRAARAKRVPPLLDDKALTEWNAQMISALARAGFALDEPRYLAAATRAADFILARLVRDGRLLRAFRAGEAKHLGVLEDHAFLVASLLDLYEATGALRFVEAAIGIQAKQDALFADGAAGGYFSTATDGEALLMRDKTIYDGAQPSGNSVAAMNLLRLGELTGDASYTARGDATLRAFGSALGGGALECPKLALALDFHLDRVKQIVIVEREAGGGAALVDVIRRRFEPNRVLAVVPADEVEAQTQRLPLLEGKRVASGSPATAYVCFQQTCKQPTSDPAVLAAQLDDVVRIEAPPLAFR